MEARTHDGIVGLVGRVTNRFRGRVIQARTNAPPWRCVECGAANHASTLECCRGCGDRELLEAVEPRASHEPVTAAGSARRDS